MVEQLHTISKWTPKRLSNLRMWISADNLLNITKDGSNYVSSWRCQANSGIDLSQSTGAAQPLWNSSGFGTNSKPYIRFDGIDDILNYNSTDIWSGDSSGSVIIIGKHLGSLNTSRLYFSSNDSSSFSAVGFGTRSTGLSTQLIGMYTYSSGVQNRIVGNTTRTTQIIMDIYTSTNIKYQLFRSDSSSLVSQIETAQAGSDNGNWFADISSRDNLSLGCLNSSAIAYYNVDIAEVIVTGSELTSNERTYLARYLNRKYGIY